MWVLKDHNNCPPGEFRYEQTIQGTLKKFGPSPLIRMVANEVSEVRKANLLPRSSYEEALQDIDEFNCQRIGNNIRWCRSTDKVYSAANPAAVNRGKGCCGAKV